MASADNYTSTEFAFMFMHEDSLQIAIVVVMMLLVWSVGYMCIINYQLFFFFNETVFNTLLGALVGFLIGTCEPIQRVIKFFLPWENFENNILPFMLIYPASKICAEATQKQLRLSIVYAIISAAVCMVLDTCAFVSYLSTRSPSHFTSGEPEPYYNTLFAIYISASVSIYDSYLCVHNFPEIRGNSLVRGSLSSHGLLAMSFALEFRRLSLALTREVTMIDAVLLALKRIVFSPLVSIVLGITTGLISSFITKHSSFLHVQQEMLVLPCFNYMSYTVALKTGLSPIITSIACEVVQGTFSINNVSEASKITYKSMLAKSSKLLGFFCTFSLGFHFGSLENKHLWRLVSFQLLATFLGVTIVARIISSLTAFWCVRRLGFQMKRSIVFLHIIIHTRATPPLMSLINLEEYSDSFRICKDHARSVQWTLYLMCSFVNIINVPLVSLLYRRLKIEPDSVDNQAEPIFQVIFRLMYHEMHQQIIYLSGERRSCESISLLLSHLKKSFIRYVLSLAFMSVPERTSPILSAYDRTISQRSNVIDQRRKSVRSRTHIYANQVCASFIVRNLGFEGFHSDDITEYFLAG